MKKRRIRFPYSFALTLLACSGLSALAHGAETPAQAGQGKASARPAAKAPQKGGKEAPKERASVDAVRIADTMEGLAAALRRGEITPEAALAQMSVVQKAWERASGRRVAVEASAPKKGAAKKPTKTRAEAASEVRARPKYLNFVKAMDERVADGRLTQERADELITAKRNDMIAEAVGVPAAQRKKASPKKATPKKASPKKPSAKKPAKAPAKAPVKSAPLRIKERIDERTAELQAKVDSGELSEAAAKNQLDSFKANLRKQVELREERKRKAAEAKKAAKAAADSKGTSNKPGGSGR